MNKNKKNKSSKQFRIPKPKISSIVWVICVFILIGSLLLLSAFTIIGFILPQDKSATNSNSTLDNLDPQTRQQLLDQIQQQQIQLSGQPIDTTTPSTTSKP